MLVMEQAFISIGQKTHYRRSDNYLLIIQKIKLHLIMTTILMGVVLWSWFRMLTISIPIIFIGVSEIFVTIRLDFNKDSNILIKAIYFYKLKLFNLYTIKGIDDYDLIEYGSGRGESGTIPSFEIGLLSKAHKTHELLSFSDPKIRHQLYLILLDFFNSPHNRQSSGR
jgi:hypothetical protein